MPLSKFLDEIRRLGKKHLNWKNRETWLVEDEVYKIRFVSVVDLFVLLSFLCIVIGRTLQLFGV